MKNIAAPFGAAILIPENNCRIYPKISRFDFLTFWPIVSSAYFPGEINREIRVTDGC
jgi:hypothetical protein